MIGCTKVGPGCDHCYADALDATRFSKTLGGGTKEIPIRHWGAGAPRHRTSVSNWSAPLAWNRKASKSGEPWRVFCASLADVFDNEWPDEVRDDLWHLIAETPHLTWLLLTKRIGNVEKMMQGYWKMPNVWIGATIVNQEEWERDKDKLLAVQSPVRFVSYEPAIGPIKWGTRMPDWIIVGGESGKDARVFEPEWARSTIRQGKESGVPVFVKQMGAKPQEIAYPAGVTDGEKARWHADGWTLIHEQHASHWRRYWHFNDRAGADPAEWPADLRVQQFPSAVAAVVDRR